ncbi:hypothetical protein BgiMline_019085, partial [Biomphalaria glabrata]
MHASFRVTQVLAMHKLCNFFIDRRANTLNPSSPNPGYANACLASSFKGIPNNLNGNRLHKSPRQRLKQFKSFKCLLRLHFTLL